MQEMHSTGVMGLGFVEILWEGSDTGQRDPCPQGTKISWAWFLPASQERGFS